MLPKGVCEPSLSAAESAAKEAMEEAGVSGRLSAEPLGRYAYRKWGGTCQVEVFSLAVESVVDEWPEDYRDREWVAPEEAAERLEEPDLKRLLMTAVRRLRQP